MTNTGLGGSTQPEVDYRFYDLHPPDAETLANIVHEQRSLAAGSRAVSAVLNQPPANNQDELSFKEKNELVESLYSVYSVYPEVFTYGGFFNSSETVNEDVIEERLFNILRHKGLPLEYHDTYVSLGKPEKYDQRADLMDEVALALMSNMPSKDFLRHYGIGHSSHGPNIEELVGKVVGLLDSEKYFLEEAEQHEKHFGRRLELINSGETGSEKPKLELYIYLLADNIIMMEEEDKEALSKEYVAAGNNMQTTVADLEALAQRSIEVSVNRFKSKAAKKRELFDMVMSGQAASYTSPK